MAINWGALIPAAARGLGAYRAGQTQGEQERHADDVAASTRAFAEWAKRRELDNSAERIAAQNQRATDALAAKEQIAARDAEIKRMLAEMQWFRARGQYGAQGDQQAIGQPERIATARNAAQAGMNTEDNQTALEIARLRAQVAQQIADQRGAAAKPKSATQRGADALLDLGLQGAEGAAALYRSGYTPGAKDRIAERLPDWMGNTFLSGEGQKLYSDLTKLVMASQYALSGKAVTEAEARRIARALVITPGDKPEMTQYKKEEIQKRLSILANNAGEEEPVVDIGGDSRARSALKKLRGQP